MAAQTQTQLRLSRPIEWGPQASRGTFWDRLSADEKRASVDISYMRKVSNQFAWEPAGKVRDAWNESVYPTIVRPLLKDNSKAIYRKVKKQISYIVACWMVGLEWHSSHPAAVIICVNKRVTKQAVKLIEDHGELRNWGFRVYGYESKISSNMGASLASELGEIPHICGSWFATGSATQTPIMKCATIGGTLILDEKCYAVTVAHPFFNTDQGDTSDEDATDLSDDEGDDSDLASSSDSDEGLALELDTAFMPNWNGVGISRLGTIPQSNRLDYYSRHADWALLEVETDQLLLVNAVVIDHAVVFPSKISSAFTKGQLWAALSTPVETKAFETKCGLFVPRLGFRDVWALKMKSAPGDCGSWVVDAQDDSIFGVIVAGMEAEGITYAMPAGDVFHEIQGRFPKMKLPSFRDPLVFWEAVKWGRTELVKRTIQNMNWDWLNTTNSEGWDALSVAVERGHEAVVRLLLQLGVHTEGLTPEADWELPSIGRSWGKEFDSGKRLGQILRGIAVHLIEHYHPVNSIVIVPEKLQKFYQDTHIPGDTYPWHDIFDDRTSSLSKLFSALKVEHHLVQDIVEERPDIPGLTPRGFEKWATLMIQAYPVREYKRLDKALRNMPISSPDDKRDPLSKYILRGIFPNAADLQLRDEVMNHISEHCGVELPREFPLRMLTPLARAAKNGHEAIAKILLDNGADIESRFGSAPPLVLAAENGHKVLVKLLLEKRARTDVTTLDTVNNLGNLYQNQGKLDQAEQMYKRAGLGNEKRNMSSNTYPRLCDEVYKRILGKLERREEEERRFAVNGTARKVLDDDFLKRFFRSLCLSAVISMGHGHINESDLIRRLDKKNLYDFLAIMIFTTCTIEAARTFTIELLINDSWPPDMFKLPVGREQLRELFREDITPDKFLAHQACFCPVTIVKGREYRIKIPGRERLPYLEEKLRAKGSFGAVYTVKIAKGHFYDPQTGLANRHPMTVARKDYLVAEESARDQEVMKKILSADRACKNIVDYYGSVAIGSTTYSLFMPMAICDLKVYMMELHKTNPNTISDKAGFIRCAYGLAGGLNFLHNGMISANRETLVCYHMDLKPSNILIYRDTGHGESPYIWKISDFGMSRVEVRRRGEGVDSESNFNSWFLRRPKAQEPSTSGTMNRRGEGTYLAPEAITATPTIKTSSDVWSLGCVISVLFAYLEEGALGVDRYSDKRGDLDRADGYDRFFIRTRGWGPFKPHPVVKEWHDRLIHHAKQRNRKEADAVEFMLGYLDNRVFKEQSKRCNVTALENMLWYTYIKYIDADPASAQNPESHNPARAGVDPIKRPRWWRAFQSQKDPAPNGRGADVNSEGGEFGNALVAASARGHEKVGQMLLDRGADPQLLLEEQESPHIS